MESGAVDLGPHWPLSGWCPGVNWGPSVHHLLDRTGPRGLCVPRAALPDSAKSLEGQNRASHSFVSGTCQMS